MGSAKTVDFRQDEVMYTSLIESKNMPQENLLTFAEEMPYMMKEEKHHSNTSTQALND